jgi:hypothetical protein
LSPGRGTALNVRRVAGGASLDAHQAGCRGFDRGLKAAYCEPIFVMTLTIFAFMSLRHYPQLPPQAGAVRPAWALRHLLWLGCVLAISGCDLLGIDTPEQIAASREAEGKAIGGACRHAGRAIEDCYTLNRRADKAAMYAGWREMNDYMKENNIAELAPVVPRPNAPKKDEEEAAEPANEGKSEAKTSAKAGTEAETKPEGKQEPSGDKKADKPATAAPTKATGSSVVTCIRRSPPTKATGKAAGKPESKAPAGGDSKADNKADGKSGGKTENQAAAPNNAASVPTRN